MVWYGMVWYVLVWFGLVWFDVLAKTPGLYLVPELRYSEVVEVEVVVGFTAVICLAK